MPDISKTLAKIEQEVIDCRLCPRLVAWREEVARVRRRAYRDETYWGRPVPGFGDRNARLLLLGLAPGAHGSNRTGRMFTGDASGNFLFAALHRAGFASQAVAISRDDDLTLADVYITATVHCVPPDNKPTKDEILNCRNAWVEDEIAALHNLEGIVLLGKIALDGLLAMPRYAHLPRKDYRFGHGALFQPGGGLPWLLCSYHPSQQNTQTGRLTTAMFDEIFETAKLLLNNPTP